MPLLQLEKGGLLDLEKVAPSLKRVRFGLGWKNGQGFDLDVSLFMLTHVPVNNGADIVRRIPNVSNIIWYKNLISPDGAVTHMGDNTEGAHTGDAENQWNNYWQSLRKTMRKPANRIQFSAYGTKYS